VKNDPFMAKGYWPSRQEIAVHVLGASGLRMPPRRRFLLFVAVSSCSCCLRCGVLLQSTVSLLHAITNATDKRLCGEMS